MAKQKIKVIREEMLQVANNVAQEKNINQDDVFSAMEQALEKSARVKYGMERDIRVNINRENGDIKLESYLKVVNSYSEEEQAREILLDTLSGIGLDKSKFGLDSLRSGGATSAANGGVSERLLKAHGRWSSDLAKDGYIKDNLNSQLLVSLNLGI